MIEVILPKFNTDEIKKLGTDFMKKIGDVVIADLRDKVQAGVNPSTGGSMPVLKPATVKRKQKNGSLTPNTRLMDSGSMMGGIKKFTKTVGGEDPDIEVTIKPPDSHPSGVSGRMLATYHHEGTKRGLPRLQWFSVSIDADQEIDKQADKFVDILLRKL